MFFFAKNAKKCKKACFFRFYVSGYVKSLFLGRLPYFGRPNREKNSNELLKIRSGVEVVTKLPMSIFPMCAGTSSFLAKNIRPMFQTHAEKCVFLLKSASKNRFFCAGGLFYERVKPRFFKNPRIVILVRISVDNGSSRFVF